MCVYVYVGMYVYIYIYIYMYMYVCICMYVCIDKSNYMLVHCVIIYLYMHSMI